MLEFFSWKKFECGKNLRVSHSPYPKGPPKHPLYGAESKNFSGLLHLEHTFRTYIQNYIQKLHFNSHQNYIHFSPSICLSLSRFFYTFTCFLRYKFNPQAPYLYPLELHYNFIIITFIIYNIIILKLHYNYTHNLVAHLVLRPTARSLHFTYIYNTHYNYTQKFHSNIHFSFPLPHYTSSPLELHLYFIFSSRPLFIRRSFYLHLELHL